MAPSSQEVEQSPNPGRFTDWPCAELPRSCAKPVTTTTSRLDPTAIEDEARTIGEFRALSGASGTPSTVSDVSDDGISETVWREQVGLPDEVDHCPFEHPSTPSITSERGMPPPEVVADDEVPSGVMTWVVVWLVDDEVPTDTDNVPTAAVPVLSTITGSSTTSPGARSDAESERESEPGAVNEIDTDPDDTGVGAPGVTWAFGVANTPPPAAATAPTPRPAPRPTAARRRTQGRRRTLGSRTS